jgi:uncharacterized protein
MSQPYTLITGASEGIGRGFAHAFAAEGRNLIMVARNGDRLAALKTDLETRHRIEVIVIQQDLAAPDAAAAIAKAVDHLTIDCLVNNAGFQVPMGPFADGDCEAIKGMIAVNVVALTDLTRFLLPAILISRGAIVNVASHAAFQPVPYMSAYAATKSYVLHLTEALSRELADSHPGQVYVMALCPGATRTQFWSRSRSPVENTRFAVMAVEEVVAVAMRELKRRRKTVVIPSVILRAATQSLRISTRSLNLKLARMLTGHRTIDPSNRGSAYKTAPEA